MALEVLFTWISHHPHWSGFIVFFIAMAESLAVVGLVVPGVAMMFAAGALVGTGALPFAPVCSWAVAGAILGDSVSFWFGRRYHAELKAFWPFRSYPGMIERGINFFQRYGGRSILFGRFVGPVRGVIPLVAGMLDMPTSQFMAVNVISALLWAPLYLFPGMVFGASLELASKVAGRLVILLILLVASLWFVTWLSKLLYRYFQSRTQLFIHAIFDWSSHHPKIAKLTDPILDPTQKDYASLTVLALLILLGGWSVSLLLGSGTAISLYILHTPWTDYLFAWLVSLAGYPATVTLFVLVSGWFLFTRQHIELIYWVFAFLFCLAAVEIPERLVPGTGHIDGYVLRAGVIYGFLAVLLAGNVSTRWRGLIYTLVSLFSITILFAQVYLQALWLESVILTLIIILIWTSILGVAYRRHRQEMVSLKAPTVISMLVVLAISGIQFSRIQEEDLEVAEPPLIISETQWKKKEWEALPAYRIQVLGKPRQPLNIQWASPLDTIQELMEIRGWQKAHSLNPYNILHWLSPDADLAQLPILPHFNEGKREALILIRGRGEEKRYLILRLWPSKRQLESSSLPIWIGSVAYLQKNELLGFLTLPDEDSANSDQALALFKKDLAELFRAGEIEFLKKSSAAGNRLLLLWAARLAFQD